MPDKFLESPSLGCCCFQFQRHGLLTVSLPNSLFGPRTIIFLLQDSLHRLLWRLPSVLNGFTFSFLSLKSCFDSEIGKLLPWIENENVDLRAERVTKITLPFWGRQGRTLFTDIREIACESWSRGTFTLAIAFHTYHWKTKNVSSSNSSSATLFPGSSLQGVRERTLGTRLLAL